MYRKENGLLMSAKSNLRSSSDIFLYTYNGNDIDELDDSEGDLDHLKFQRQILKGKNAIII